MYMLLVHVAIKVGAIAAGAAILALGARRLASYSLSDERHDSMIGVGMERFDGSGGSSTTGGGQSSYYRDFGNENESMSPRMIKVLSCNVRLHEDMEVCKRIKSLGRLILLHSPDVVLFQEVTPNIYKIFQESKLWQTYKCSVSPEHATRNYFSVLMSKLPVKMFYHAPFPGSTMGRDLSIAEINIGNPPKNLLIATSHLESPTPLIMHSMERQTQAKQAVNLLHKSPNVIFGGDMNWDEDFDGPFPLLDGWVDAWRELRPGEEGLTFDTRFVCKLEDFRLVSVGMVGLETIEGLSLYNQRRKQLAALPNGYYGLLLTATEITTSKGLRPTRHWVD